MGQPLFYRGEAVTVAGKGDGHVTWDNDDMCGVEFDDPRIPTSGVPKSQVSTR
jgi:hypothetical protein